jgi:DNA-binding NarL/FixJ family response regulator
MGWSAALVSDLLFGSRLQGALAAAGTDLELVASTERLAETLTARESAPDLLIIDLADPAIDLHAALATLRAGEPGGDPSARTLGFYSHVHPQQRSSGERAGLDMVVPRSRLAREAPTLVASLTARNGG